jgi:hypothetical protein
LIWTWFSIVVVAGCVSAGAYTTAAEARDRALSFPDVSTAVILKE